MSLFDRAVANPSVQTGTRIEMLGVQLQLSGIRSSLSRFSRGFPIEVFFNGESLPRPMALDQMTFEDSPVGKMALDDIEGERTANLFLFLQGLPVFHGTWWSGFTGRAVVHLDSRRFFARMPDRDKLRDEHQVVRQVEQAVKERVIGLIAARKARMSAQDFSETYYAALKAVGALDMLNDVPWLPRQCLRAPDDSDPELGTSEDCTHQAGTGVSRQTAKDGAVRLCRMDDDVNTENLPFFMYCWAQDCLLVDGLDNDHWVWKHVVDFTSPDADYEIVARSGQQAGTFDGEYVYGAVLLCDSYEIHVSGFRESAVLSSYALYADDVFYVPKDEQWGSVVGQASRYLDENEDYDESAYDRDCDAFRTFITNLRAKDPVDVMKRLIGELNLSAYPSLHGLTFLVSVTPNGCEVKTSE